MLLFDLDEIQVEPSKHFRNTTMRKRDGDIHDLRDAIGQANRVVRGGQRKPELWTQKGGPKKLVVAHYAEERCLLVIAGTEGRTCDVLCAERETCTGSTASCQRSRASHSIEPSQA